jgi:hypothetical protein
MIYLGRVVHLLVQVRLRVVAVPSALLPDKMTVPPGLVA